MNRNKLRAIVDGLLVLVSIGMIGLVMCWSIETVDWPGWYRLVNALPLPDWLKTRLLWWL